MPGPAGYVYGDVPNRTIAYIIDVILLAVINLVVFAIVVGVMGASEGTSIVITIIGLILLAELVSGRIRAAMR